MKTLILTREGRLRVLPDSALGRNRQPWFVPDFGDNWRASTAMAVRIGRLGKGVRLKFARRYFDAMTLLWVPETDGVECAVLDCMDGAAVPGEWLPIPDDADLNEFERMLERVTRFCTVKTGDILCILTQDATALDATVDCELNGNNALHFNVK